MRTWWRLSAVVFVLALYSTLLPAASTRAAEWTDVTDQRLTDPAFTHRVDIAPNGQYFVDVAQTHDSPPSSRLMDVNGKLVADWSDPMPECCEAGPIGLQLHSNKEPQEVQFRGLILTKDPEDKLVTVTEAKP